MQLTCALWIAFQLNVWGFNQSWRYSLSRSSGYEVSSEARRLLAQLDESGRSIEVVLVFSLRPDQEGVLTKEILLRALRVCREFEHFSPRFRVQEVVDTARDPVAWQRVRDRYKIETTNSLHLVSEGRRESLDVDDLAVLRRPSDGSGARRLHVERERIVESVAAALQRILWHEQPLICFSQGQGEIQLGAPQPPASIEALASALRERGFELRGVDLGREPRVPEGTRLFIAVCGSGREFRPFEGEARVAIERFVDGGGSLLVFAPFGGRTGLEEFLRGCGLQLQPGIVAVEALDRQGVHRPTERFLVSGFNPTHPICANFDPEDFRAAVRMFRPIGVAAPAVPLITSDARSWVEQDERLLRKDASDPSGAFNLVAACDERVSAGGPGRTPPGRVVLFGSWTPALDGDFHADPDCKQLILNSVYWLTRREAVLSDVGRDVSGGRIELDERLLRALFWTTVVVMPGLALVAGLGVFYWRRRST